MHVMLAVIAPWAKGKLGNNIRSRMRHDSCLASCIGTPTILGWACLFRQHVTDTSIAAHPVLCYIIAAGTS